MERLITIEHYYFWILFYSICGWIYESILCSFLEKRWVNRGFLNGPYCPIYGFGAILVMLMLGWCENPVLLFLLGAVVTCTLEYITSYVMEKLFHARWWDYSDQKFNLNGRVCLIGAIAFGSFSLALIKLIQPAVSAMTDSIPQIWMHIICAVTFILVCVDIGVTLTGFAGFNERLRKITSTLADNVHGSAVYSKFSDARAAISEVLTKQQQRMIRSFPKLRSIKYNETLKRLRTVITRRMKGDDSDES